MILPHFVRILRGGRLPSANRRLLFFLITLAVLLTWKASVYGTPLVQQILFWLILIGYVILPGVLLYKIAYADEHDWLMVLGMGWAVGLALQAPIYLALKILGLSSLFIAYPLLIPLLFYLVKSRGITLKPDQFPQLGVLFGLLVIIAAAIVVSFYYSLRVVLERQGAIYGDIVVHISQIAELTHHWPMENPSRAGTVFGYQHYFSHIFPASVSQIASITASDLILQITPGFHATLLTIQLFNLGYKVSKRGVVSLLATSMILFHADVGQAATRYLNLEQSYALRSAFGQALYESMSTQFGAIYIATFMILLHRNLVDQEQLGGWQGFVLGILAFMAAGSKTSALPALLIALAVTVGWQFMIRRQIPWHVLIPLLIIGFITTVTTIAMIRNTLSINPGMVHYEAASLVESTPFYKSIIELLRERALIAGAEPVSSLLKLAITLLWIVGYLGWAGVGTVIWLVQRRWRVNPFAVWLILAALAGLGLALLFQVGRNNEERSFLDAGIIGLALLASMAIASMVDNFSPRQLPAATLLAILAAPILLYAFLRLYGGLYSDYFTLREGAKLRDPLAADYLEALEWIRTRTPVNAVFVTDHEWILVSAFGERRAYYEPTGLGNIEREALRDRLYDEPDAEIFNEFLSEYPTLYVVFDNIDFLGGGFSVQVKPLGQWVVFPPEYADVVFSNEAVRIYLLHGPSQ